ncbi:MAG TPA: sialidase family protein [Candidatus Udaeobacter sp.]|nr:sialidase family protein [Candidatus Udaeobacter sp.]
MIKKPNSQSAFFNLHVLAGLFIVLAGVFLALIGFGTFSGLTASSAQAQQSHKVVDVAGLPPGFDCASIAANGIDKQENHRAGLIMIACGESQGGSPLSYGAFSQRLYAALTAPFAYGGADVNLVTGAENISHPTQSETYALVNPDNPNQIVVTYNDSRTASANYSGASFSSDGGTTFSRLNPSPFASGHGTNFGDPVTLYNKPTSTFFGIFLATGCGGQGIGAWKSTNGGATWTTGPCIHNGSSDDRESGWSDNNPSSPFFGRMYVSWNNFAVGGGALQASFSTDNGNTWTLRTVSNTGTFIRNTQITGDMSGNGTIYIAGMDEGGGGFPHNNVNHVYRSTDGGNTWVHTYTGPAFPGPGVGASGYFACMFTGSPSGVYWRHEGWGEPAALNNVVHLVYSRHGAGADAGDVFYIRSTDSGVTFDAPLKLNTDTTTRPQWQPNISVSPTGSLFATWYDGREFGSCTYGNPGVPCYRMWSRKSTDNGATWSPDSALSDVPSPLPAQPDFTVQGTYAGDYDYGSATATQHVTSWVDGRVTLSGSSQQDAFFDREPSGGGTAIELTARLQTQGDNHRVKLTWSPADGGSVNVSRNGNIKTTADDGQVIDNLGTRTGTFTYQVCETDSGDCSNEVQVQVP